MEVSFEVEKMKEKKRLLQHRISEMRANIRKKENIVSNLEQELELLKYELSASGEDGSAGENKLNTFMKDICVVIEAIVTDEAFMKAKYTTQSSQMYYKIEKDVFEDYIGRLSGLTVKDFIEFCKKLSFIKIENNKCIFPSGKTRVYFLSKGIVDEMRE